MDLTIHNALLDTTLENVHIGIINGKIERVSQDEIPPGDHSIDAQGAMASPAFIDPHFHLENSLLWREPLNESGTLREAIDIYAGIKINLTTDDIVARATQAVREALPHGTLWMRSHVDIDQNAKLNLFNAVKVVREKFEDVFDIKIVAFPQHGMAKNPEAVELMWEALESGADLVGGMPHCEEDMDEAARHIEIAFEMAKKHDVDIDMHVDETDDPYWHSLELLAEKTIEEGYQGRVVAGHCCAMAAWDDKLAERVIEKVRLADITVITNTPVNLILQGRMDGPPVRRGITRVKQLLEAGVNVSCGQDDLMNHFYPFGKMDMLEVANFVAHTAHLSSPSQIQAAFDMPRYAAAKAFRLEGYGIKEGNPANLVLIEATSALDALRRQPARLFVIRKGKILTQTELQRKFSDVVPT
jgi:cytosine deaminase